MDKRSKMRSVDKTKIRDFFDGWALSWDEGMVKDDQIMNAILDNAGIKEGQDVLDVACGTGVMIDYYLQRDVRSVTGVDFSERMCEIAAGKFSDGRVRILCEDIENYTDEDGYDAIVVYNSFPHFPDPEKLIEHLSFLLRKGGILTVAHGMSRDRVNSHHSNVSYEIKRDLPQADRLEEIFSRHLKVTSVVSDARMYQVCGKKI